MRFTKMHGLGNDYIYIYGEVSDNVCELSQKLSKPHFGIGSDGMVYISSSDIADFKMRIFNADGSEAKMCGNGIRCVGKYVYDKGYTDKKQITVETLSGVKTLDLHTANGKVESVSVDMGKASVGDEQHIYVCDMYIIYTPVSIGNDHAVIFTDCISDMHIHTLGYAIAHHDNFPDGVNVEFVQLLAKNRLRMRVWERGSGITLACGTGACAVASAAIKHGMCDCTSSIEVVLDGGVLEVCISEENNVIMTGSAKTVFEGEIIL